MIVEMETESKYTQQNLRPLKALGVSPLPNKAFLSETKLQPVSVDENTKEEMVFHDGKPCPCRLRSRKRFHSRRRVLPVLVVAGAKPAFPPVVETLGFPSVCLSTCVSRWLLGAAGCSGHVLIKAVCRERWMLQPPGRLPQVTLRAQEQAHCDGMQGLSKTSESQGSLMTMQDELWMVLSPSFQVSRGEQLEEWTSIEAITVSLTPNSLPTVGSSIFPSLHLELLLEKYTEFTLKPTTTGIELLQAIQLLIYHNSRLLLARCQLFLMI